MPSARRTWTAGSTRRPLACAVLPTLRRCERAIGTTLPAGRGSRFAVLPRLWLLVVAGAPGAPAAAGATADDPPTLVISHRGASADAPEHTFAAYDRAVAEHTDVLECDLQLTVDDVLVCMHDTTVDRTTGWHRNRPGRRFTLEQLRDMDFGAWFGPEFAGAAIVPFEEQLRCYRRSIPTCSSRPRPSRRRSTAAAWSRAPSSSSTGSTWSRPAPPTVATLR